MADKEKWMNDKRTQELIDKIKHDFVSKDSTPYSASRISQGYIDQEFPANFSGEAPVSFDEFPNTNYIVAWDCDKLNVDVAVINKTTTGFLFVVSNNNASAMQVHIDYTVFEVVGVGDVQTEAQASEVQSGYAEGTIPASGSGTAKALFEVPFSDNDYAINYECDRLNMEIAIIEKTASGFLFLIENNNALPIDAKIPYRAFKLLEGTDVNNRLRIVTDLDSEVGTSKELVIYGGDTTYIFEEVDPIGNENPYESGWYELISNEYVPTEDETVDGAKTYYEQKTEYWCGGVYRYESGRWVLKSAEGGATPVEIIIDDELDEESTNPVENQAITKEIKKRLLVTDTMQSPSADLKRQIRLYIGAKTDALEKGGIYECQETSTDVFEWVLINKADIDLSLYKKIFTGTQATWNSLTDEQKKEYDIANITDDTEDSVVDEVKDGDMRAVTSNAVADAINSIGSYFVEKQMKQAGETSNIVFSCPDVLALFRITAYAGNGRMAQWYTRGGNLAYKIQTATVSSGTATMTTSTSARTATLNLDSDSSWLCIMERLGA